MKRERGSATIEAVVSFTGFLFVLFTLLNIANYCRAQMIISNAVDAAAKELSEYSYFYKMSGLQKFNDKTNANTKVAHDKINNVVSGLGDAYSAFSNAVGDSKEIALNAQDAFSSGNFQGIVDSYSAIKSNAADYKGSYDTVYSQVSAVADNPMVYIKSIAASAAGEAYDIVKSRLIAAPLGKALTAAHLSSKEMSADDYLKSIGVVNGLDGLNFNMSSIFTINEPDSIHLVCYYKLSLMQFMDLELESPVFCKESVVRAWLGGDDVLVVIGDSDDEASSDDADTDESSDTKVIPDADEAAESTDQAAQDNAEDESSEEIVKGDEKDDKDPYEELLAAMALYEKDKEDGNKQAVIDLCKEMNDAGGFDYADAELLYKWAKEYGVPYESLTVNTKDGRTWSESSFKEKVSNSGITQYEYDTVLSEKKGSRPAVETYADAEYIEKHLAKFNSGGSFIITSSSYEKYTKSSGIIGYDDNSQFIMPKSECDKILSSCSSNEEIAKALGITLKDGEQLIRIDITGLDEFNLRMATGNEQGANDQWIPGGYTSGGTSEAVVDQILLEDPKVKVSELK